MKTAQRLTKLALVIVTISALAACQPSAQEQTGQTPPPGPMVSVAKVINERVTEWDEFTGRLEAPQTVELRPRVSGYIDEVLFHEGAFVEAGDILFQIDPKPFETEVARLQADLVDAQSQAVLAKRELERGKHLHKQKAMSSEALDNRLARNQQAAANVLSKQAALEQAQLDLSYTHVEAPISGRTSRAAITKGNYVTAGQSQLTSLVSTDKVYAYFDADEQTFLKYNQLAREGLRPDSAETKFPILMGLANDKQFPHAGYIDFIDNQVDRQTGTIRIRGVFNNAEGLFTPGLFARVKLVSSASHDGILIDEKAIGTDLNHKFVLVLDEENNAQYRPVTLGKKINGLRLITDGLTENDTIVVNGLQRVRPGSPVSPEVVPMASEQVLAKLKGLQQRVDLWLEDETIATTELPAANPG
ncbi:MAG: efflux RND transporter periplasmic adaptor subunit [Pseudomonadales bacterium]